ncbi:MAG: thiolase family protein [Candidatus Geothermincolia bacterium]
MRKIGIVAQAQIMSGSIGLPRERMLYDLVKGLYDSVGITRDDIDTFVLNSNDFEVGHTIANVFEDTPVGAYMKDETHVEADGLWAASYAAMRVMAGNYDTALVVGNSSGASTFRPYLVMDYQLNPVYDRQMGLMNELSTAALQANAYLNKFGASEEDLNKIAARLLRNAALNPNAVRSNAKATADDVLASDSLYEPLRQLQCYPFTDGACAMILASEERAKELTDKPVWIKGMGNSVDSFYIGERDLATSRSAKLAAERAYKMAGIDDPTGQLDLAEVSAKFAHQEPILTEALGLFAEGSAARVANEGLADLGGAMPVCPSGGGLGAYLFSAAGLVRIAECVRQLQGLAGDAQVPGAKTAVAHGQDGFCAQHNAVMVLSTEEG